MKYEVRTSKVENGTNGVVAMATIVIEDKFAVNNIRLVHKPEEDKYAVYYPSRKTTKTDSGYMNICHPYSAELSQQLKEAILTAYNTGENQIVENDTEFKLDVNVTPYEKDSLIGLCNVKFSKDNEFAIKDITLRKTAEDKEMMCMPSYKKKDESYGDVCNPITKEFREELNNAVMEAYKVAKTQSNEKSATYEHKKAARNSR